MLAPRGKQVNAEYNNSKEGIVSKKKTCPWPDCDARYVTRKSSDNGMVCRACERPIAMVNGHWYRRREDAPEFQLVKTIRDGFSLGFPLESKYNKYRMAMSAADTFLERCNGNIELALMVAEEMRKDSWLRHHCTGVLWLLNDKFFWKFHRRAKNKLEIKKDKTRKERTREQSVAPANLSEW